ncbi:lipopolysaccharide biosynthesis protein [Halobacterium salinarum]|uniref:lipopolysaccharide biosynthesis protein n=1 Tax=Halobacterium salinarum TaxID=2242 RepID=UPI00255230F7|nr:lipopolysaccharide biosynthesis protein [Halobacterium salinarum]MDL0118513.1 lipopolysaccharide biosynthesis protein [Halobacterium salinarum]MDL0118726.1 lipopolysaccharide biosynthesis protein [Halobacterium salinarum]MDL0118762.1 lipopolysaccharide biosynthesis protein [Halobacterium salinarum]
MLELLRSIYERLTAGGSATEQAVQSGIWVAGINVGDRVLQLLKVIILARLLSPAAFGLLGIALLAIAALRQFSKLGFNEALIQHEDEDVDEYLNTAWIMKIARGGLIAAIAFLAAPYLAVFFGEPSAEPLIRVIGFSPLILGLQNPAVVYFQKNLNFHREFVYQVGGRFVDLIVAVVIAFVFRSVWALAMGIVAMNLVKFGLSYGIHEYRPNIEFNLAYGKEMFAFGKWMFISSILVFLYGQGDDAFVGWFFTASSLGFYQMAYRYSNAPATEVTHVISRVVFPTLSKLQDDVDRLREGFLRAVQISTTVAFPMAAGIAVVAPQFVLVVLGNQWRPVIPVMQVLAVWGGIRAFGANIGPVYKSTGRPDLEAKIQVFKVIIIALVIYPVAEIFGLIGVSAIIVGSSLLVLPVHLYYILSITEGRLAEVIEIIAYPLVGSVAMAVGVKAVDAYIILGISPLNFLLLIIWGVILYVATMFTLEYTFDCEFLQLYSVIKRGI